MLTEYMELVLIPILVGLVEVIKQAGINERYIPIISIALGLIIGIIFTGLDIKEGIITGLQLGLAAIGLYSGTKNVARK